MNTATHNRAVAVLAADAGWDALLGVVLCLLVWPTAAGALGLPDGRPWPVFLVLGLGCLGFAAVLARGARGVDTAGVTRVAMLGNAVATVAGVVTLLFVRAPLHTGGTVAVAIGTLGCAAFAILERRTSH